MNITHIQNFTTASPNSLPLPLIIGLSFSTSLKYENFNHDKCKGKKVMRKCAKVNKVGLTKTRVNGYATEIVTKILR